MSANILSSEERQQLTTIPTVISDVDLVRFFTLASRDLAVIGPHLKPNHRLDKAAHICLLRWLGWSPVQVDRLPETARVALCRQLDLEMSSGSLEPPSERTSRRQATRARQHLGWRKYTAALEPELREWLAPLAAEHDHARALFDALCRHLYREKIVRPGPTRLERLVEATRTAVRRLVAQAITSQLTPAQKQKLDQLLVVPAGEIESPLQRLKETPPRATADELLTVLGHIETIRGIGLDKLDLGPEQIHPNRVKLLAQRVKRRSNWSLDRLKPVQRYPLLVCFLVQSLYDWVDLAVSMHGEVVAGIFRRAETKRNSDVVARGQSLNTKVLLLADLARLILDEDGIPDTKLRAAIYQHIPRDRLDSTARECDAVAQPADYHAYSYAARSYPYLRRFGPPFLRTLAFQAETEEAPLLQAISFMREVDSDTRAFEDPPLKFVPWRWRSYVIEEEDETVNRQMYELCLQDTITKAVDRGELWVADSRAYTRFQDDWIADEAWPAARLAFLEQFPHLANVETFLQRAKETLDAQMAATNRDWLDLQDEVRVEDGTVRLTRLKKRDLPAGTARLQGRLTSLFPRIGVAQLLMEVNHWMGVDERLTNLYAHERPVEDLVAKKLAVVMAEGMNIGLQNMSYSVPGVSYKDLAGVYDRHIREDTLRQAITAVVNFYHQLPITHFWGDGTSSSSDGQLFGVPIRTVHAQYHPHAPSKSGRAVSVYTHVSDHAIPFYGQVIHHLSQEGAYVLDGLLHHETDLQPRRHFVDTGGYQDTLWGACHLLGFELEPRLRDIGDMRLFRMRRRVDQYPHIQSLFSQAINTRAIRENWDNVLRLMASIYAGVVPASRVLSKLNVYHVESGLYKALREIGRIAKTSFLLDYFTQQEVRRRVQTGLNRQESVHALARALFMSTGGTTRAGVRGATEPYQLFTTGDDHGHHLECGISFGGDRQAAR